MLNIRLFTRERITLNLLRVVHHLMKHQGESHQRRVDNTNTSLLSNYDQSAHNQIVNQWNHYNSTSFGFHGKPTTELLGWRRPFPEEIVRMEEGTFFLLCIPPSSWRNDSEVTVMRNAFFDRLLEESMVCRRSSGQFRQAPSHYLCVL